MFIILSNFIIIAPLFIIIYKRVRVSFASLILKCDCVNIGHPYIGTERRIYRVVLMTNKNKYIIYNYCFFFWLENNFPCENYPLYEHKQAKSTKIKLSFPFTFDVVTGLRTYSYTIHCFTTSIKTLHRIRTYCAYTYIEKILYVCMYTIHIHYYCFVIYVCP